MAVHSVYPARGAPLVTLYSVEIGGKPRFRAAWYVDGKRKMKMFSIEKDAVEYCATLCKGLRKGGNRDTLVSAADMALLKKAKRLGEREIDLMLRRRDAGSSVLLGELEERFLSIYEHRALSTREDVTSRTRRIMVRFGDRPVGALSAQEIEDWYLNELPGSVRHRNNSLSVLSTILSMARRWEYLPADRQTATERVRKLEARKKDPEILSIDEARAIFEKVRADLRGYLALGMFAGLRPSEAAGIKGERPGIVWGDVRFDEGLIRIRREVAGKTGKPRVIEPPGNVFAWLKSAGPIGKPDEPVCYRKSQWLFTEQNREIQMKHPWPKDASRHSFCSYFLALSGSIDLTAKQAGNSPRVIEENYNNPRAKSEGEAWFAITPG